MIRKSKKPYIILLAVILMLMSIPAMTSESIRGKIVSWLAPFWGSFTHSNASSNENGSLQKVQLENQQLRNELIRLRQLVQQEKRISRQLVLLQDKDSNIRPLLQQHHKELLKQLSFQLQAVPAQIIFRSPSSWNSSLWLNVGEANNKTLGRTAIVKDSPVVVGNSIVGVVDYVGMNQCRVRLITDSGLTPSVRCVRGDLQQWMLLDSLSQLTDHMALYKDLLNKETLAGIENIRDLLRKNFSHSTHYLAKGELSGSSQPLWRSRGTLLRGIGFNYDFEDEQGPARDLRSGTPVSGSLKKETIPLLKVHDLLVTTGMDGVFPPGLYVGEVTKINVLKEGDYYYELEAHPTVGSLDELSLVYVIPPLGYNAEDQPPLIGL